jgi:hypothetical protein
MIDLIVAAAIATHPASTRTALALCRPALARKAGGQIATIAIARSSIRSGMRRIAGRVTVFAGMGPPPPGSASAHHLIRADYNYVCSVRGGRVRSLTLSR